jgi:hypothetical protein
LEKLNHSGYAEGYIEFLRSFVMDPIKRSLFFCLAVVLGIVGGRFLAPTPQPTQLVIKAEPSVVVIPQEFTAQEDMIIQNQPSTLGKLVENPYQSMEDGNYLPMVKKGQTYTVAGQATGDDGVVWILVIAEKADLKQKRGDVVGWVPVSIGTFK